VRFVGRPMLLEVEQEVRPVSWKAMPLEVGDGEREAVVDADDGRGVRREFLAKPLGETAPRPVPARAGRRLNLHRFARVLGLEHADALATGVSGHRAGVVDADVAAEWGNPVTSVLLNLTDSVSDRLNQLGTIVPHIAHGGAHLPCLHFLCGVRPEQVHRQM
jgi:hypothetical protein